MSDNKPPLTIKVGDQTIKMTYGLQMDLQKMIPDSGQIVAMLTDDPFIRDIVIRRVLTPADHPVTDDDSLIGADKIEIDADTALAILDWVSEHLLYFFVKSAGQAARLANGYKDQMGQLQHSMSGTADSTSTEPSAGPSE